MKRLIVCLDVRDGKTTKGIKFKENVDIGDPVEMAAKYYEDGVDELVFYDITASHEGRAAIVSVVEAVAKRVFIPFTVGGGISGIEEMKMILYAGADKISVNSQAVKNHSLIEEGAAIFGSQCIVLGMDAAADRSMPSGYRVLINGGRVSTDLDALEWAIRAENLGAGEIVLNSVDADGTKEGYECRLTSLISSVVNVPVVASGGAGKPEHLAEVLTEGKADAALVASIVHYNEYSIKEIKEYLKAEGIPVRL
jgi:cyclase